ncbi:MAG: hypothetical protein E7264_07310 [Lachnospiraceae bacterium]|nr:hypothetical protein [Lachnospiraceae bacterium]
MIIFSRRTRSFLFVLGIVIIMYGCILHDSVSYAMKFPRGVRVVASEKEMIKDMVKRMKQHPSSLSYYYPGIESDMKKYKKGHPPYVDFFDELAKKDGYTMGTVSGYCVTISGEEERYVTFQFGYLTTKRQEKRITKLVKRLVKRIGHGSRLQKVKKAHDYLIEHMQYDAQYYTPYYAFVKGKGMCMSYALAFQRIMQEMKIPCIYVKGKEHAWNMVKVGGYWYNVDVTWDDNSYARYRYFMKTDKDFFGHKRPKSRWFRSLKKAKKSYQW